MARMKLIPVKWLSVQVLVNEHKMYRAGNKQPREACISFMVLRFPYYLDSKNVCAIENEFRVFTFFVSICAMYDNKVLIV